MIYYWSLMPLVVAISLVYSASRHESWSKIGWQSLRLSGAIFGILLVTTIVLLLVLLAAQYMAVAGLAALLQPLGRAVLDALSLRFGQKPGSMPMS